MSRKPYTHRVRNFRRAAVKHKGRDRCRPLFAVALRRGKIAAVSLANGPSMAGKNGMVRPGRRKRDGADFFIYLRDTLSDDAMREVLLHEIEHCLAWSKHENAVRVDTDIRMNALKAMERHLWPKK